MKAYLMRGFLVGFEVQRKFMTDAHGVSAPARTFQLYLYLGPLSLCIG